MTPSPEYEIQTVKDFLKVPADRRPDCLTEFLHYLDHMEPYRELFDTGAVFPAFVWCDDGHQTTAAEAAVITRQELRKVLSEMERVLEEST
jgi:hypothetical protein